METQLSKVEEEKLKLLVEVSEYKATVQTLKEELNESQHKTTHLTKEKTSLQELLKSEELIREKVRLYKTNRAQSYKKVRLLFRCYYSSKMGR